MTDHTRLTAKLASWGLVLTVGGIVMAVVAAHESAYHAIWSAAGQPPLVHTDDGSYLEQPNWAVWEGVVAGVALVAGLWCLIAVIWRIADRADGGRASALNRSGAPLPAATLALEPVPSDVGD